MILILFAIVVRIFDSQGIVVVVADHRSMRVSLRYTYCNRHFLIFDLNVCFSIRTVRCVLYSFVLLRNAAHPKRFGGAIRRLLCLTREDV